MSKELIGKQGCHKPPSRLVWLRHYLCDFLILIRFYIKKKSIRRTVFYVKLCNRRSAFSSLAPHLGDFSSVSFSRTDAMPFPLNLSCRCSLREIMPIRELAPNELGHKCLDANYVIMAFGIFPLEKAFVQL
ncbi:MAG TPA: hypothetical protein DCZ41_05580 [Firmicutes bacterium]|nr:hypothetical protein [Bacillota bacterium]